MNEGKMVLNVYVDNLTVLYSESMPEVLKKHFKSMEITVNTLKQLTNNREFNNITCSYIDDENNADKKKMFFSFEGKDLCINITSPLKKETLSLKEELCLLRDTFLHSYIKDNKVVYIIESKPKNFTTTTIKLYNSNGLVKEFLINSSVIGASKLYMFFREEKKLLNNYFKFNNVIYYSSLEDAHITELRDKYSNLNFSGVKNFVLKSKTIGIVNEEEKEEDINSYDLDELDDLLYKTGLISIKDIKEELSKRKENKKVNTEEKESEIND